MENSQFAASNLCANGCGFYGTPQTMNLCSKCYRDSCLKMKDQKTGAQVASQTSTTTVRAAEKKEQETTTNIQKAMMLFQAAIDEEKAAAKIAARENLTASLAAQQEIETAREASQKYTIALSAEPSSASSSSVFNFAMPRVEETPKPKDRCSCCNKKVGLLGFNCRCGATFCSSHRYPEKHKCAIDYKAPGKDALAKANPVVKADKLPDRI